jgi:hypothetical protein
MANQVSAKSHWQFKDSAGRVQEQMTDMISHRTAQRAGRHSELSALPVGFVIFGLLWILHIPLREIYVPSGDDISQFADSLLVAPGARWHDWFTRGYSHSFDFYPDWPAHAAEYARIAWMRPAFQFLIYLAHFVLGRDWASYQLINYIAIAGMGAAAFQIAQTVLGLRTGPSLVAAMLVVLSPPLFVSSVLGVAFAIDPLATFLVAGAFLAILARRDFLCLALLFLALLTKENALWVPFAAATTIMLRPKLDESLRRRAFTAAAMLLPVATWLGLRFAFFGGIGGTYATEGYTPFAHFLKLTFFKLTHMHYLLTHIPPMGDPRGTAFLLLDRGTELLIYALISLWALRVLPEAVNGVRSLTLEMRWPTVDAVSLVNLWAASALAFHFALPLLDARYATSVVVFLWPALVAEVERRGKAFIWLGLAVLCAGSLIHSYHLFEWITAPGTLPNSSSSMDAALRQAPTGTRQIYVVSAGGLQEVNPESVRLIIGVPAQIIRIVEIDEWRCHGANVLVAFDHSMADGVVSMILTLPSCANFYFRTDRFNAAITDGRLYRNDAIRYELPEVDPLKWPPPNLFLGRSMTIHIRPKGPARFIIEHGGPNGIAWFDTP